MIAVGDISMLKPNTKAIPIDKNGDDTPVYLNDEFKFYFDIEGKGKLVYTVQPLTLYTESKLLSELGYELNRQIRKVNAGHIDLSDKDGLKRMADYRMLNTSRIDKLVVEFSRCINPELILPKLRGILKAFTKDNLVWEDYAGLYDELVRIGHYPKPVNRLIRWIKRRMKTGVLMRKSLDNLMELTKKVIDAYTYALLGNQEIYLKLKVLVNMLRYEREFKKKLLMLFSENFTRKDPPKSHPGLDNSTLLSEQNAGMMGNGSLIPVF
jgi:hypothetical protein